MKNSWNSRAKQNCGDQISSALISQKEPETTFSTVSGKDQLNSSSSSVKIKKNQMSNSFKCIDKFAKACW